MKTDYKVIKTHNISTGHTELYKTGKNSYSLKHYSTEVLRVTNGKIKKLIPASRSSYSAIVQTLKYLDLPKINLKDACMKLNNGKTMDEIQSEWRLTLTNNS